MGATCGACSKTTGKPCPLAPVPGKTRCKWHGGKSTGPRTEQGKQVARENGKKGGRPRKQDPNSSSTPLVRCVDCFHLSAAHSCMAADRGGLGFIAPLWPMPGEWRNCIEFLASK